MDIIRTAKRITNAIMETKARMVSMLTVVTMVCKVTVMKM
jgi:hypothetical protein